MTRAYHSHKHGPGRCRNGHEKPYAGKCEACQGEYHLRAHSRRVEAERPVRADADGLLDMVLALIAEREAA